MFCCGLTQTGWPSVVAQTHGSCSHAHCIQPATSRLYGCCSWPGKPVRCTCVLTRLREPITCADWLLQPTRQAHFQPSGLFLLLLHFSRLGISTLWCLANVSFLLTSVCVCGQTRWETCVCPTDSGHTFSNLCTVVIVCLPCCCRYDSFHCAVGVRGDA